MLNVEALLNAEALLRAEVLRNVEAVISEGNAGEQHSAIKQYWQVKVYSVIEPSLQITNGHQLWCWLASILLFWRDWSAVVAAESSSQHKATTSAAKPQTVRLTSLEWAPYTGAALPEGGEITRLLRQVFAQIGYQLQVNFLPWNTAVHQVISGENGHLAYYPEYQLQDPTLLLSGAIGYISKIIEDVGRTGAPVNKGGQHPVSSRMTGSIPASPFIFLVLFYVLHLLHFDIRHTSCK